MKLSINRPASVSLFICLCLAGGMAVATGFGTFPGPHFNPPPVAMVAIQAPVPSQPQKPSAADRDKIQRVITLQIRAFARNEEAVAFSYATPDARRFFGSPRAFMDMVRTSYSALYKHTSHEFLEAAVINGVVVQPLKILTTDGEIIVALYTVEQQADKEWRVGSCELAPSTLRAI